MDVSDLLALKRSNRAEREVAAANEPEFVLTEREFDYRLRKGFADRERSVERQVRKLFDEHMEAVESKIAAALAKHCEVRDDAISAVFVTRESFKSKNEELRAELGGLRTEIAAVEKTVT